MVPVKRSAGAVATTNGAVTTTNGAVATTNTESRTTILRAGAPSRPPRAPSATVEADTRRIELLMEPKEAPPSEHEGRGLNSEVHLCATERMRACLKLFRTRTKLHLHG
jgi:hypothetical protein